MNSPITQREKVLMELAFAAGQERNEFMSSGDRWYDLEEWLFHHPINSAHPEIEYILRSALRMEGPDEPAQWNKP